MKRLFSLMLCLLLFLSMPLSAEAKSGFSHGTREEKRIALSFDDGPHPVFTLKILEILKKYEITATFFMIGRNVEYYPAVARAVHANGHEIGNHTYTHPHMRQTDVETLRREIRMTEETLKKNGIPKPKLFRPPEGFRSAEQIHALETEGYETVIWSLDTHDWQGRAVGEIVSVVLNGVQGGDVLLFHDYTSRQNTTITALEQLIPALLKDGYEFVTISELMC